MMVASSAWIMTWSILALLVCGSVLFLIVLAYEKSRWSRGRPVRREIRLDRAGGDVQTQTGPIPRSSSVSLRPDRRVYAVLRSAGKAQRLPEVPRPPVVDWLLAGAAPLPQSEHAWLPLPPSRRLSPSMLPMTSPNAPGRSAPPSINSIRALSGFPRQGQRLCPHACDAETAGKGCDLSSRASDELPAAFERR